MTASLPAPHVPSSTTFSGSATWRRSTFSPHAGYDGFEMTLGHILDAPGKAKVDGKLYDVWCYDPDTGDALAQVPQRVSFDPSKGNPTVANRRLLHKDQYEPDDPGSPWVVDGPCVHSPTG